MIFASPLIYWLGALMLFLLLSLFSSTAKCAGINPIWNAL